MNKFKIMTEIWNNNAILVCGDFEILRINDNFVIKTGRRHEILTWTETIARLDIILNSDLVNKTRLR